MDWLNTLKTVAPTVATALGGPLAGLAVKVASEAIGGDGTKESIENAILSGNPDALLKLKEADSNLKIELKKLDISLEQLASDDRKSARDLAKVDMRPQIILSAIYTIGYCAVLWQFVTGEVVIPTESETAFNIILGVLTAAQTQIMNFWFGSSSGSKDKTHKLTGAP